MRTDCGAEFGSFARLVRGCAFVCALGSAGLYLDRELGRVVVALGALGALGRRLGAAGPREVVSSPPCPPRPLPLPSCPRGGVRLPNARRRGAQEARLHTSGRAYTVSTRFPPRSVHRFTL